MLLLKLSERVFRCPWISSRVASVYCSVALTAWSDSVSRRMAEMGGGESIVESVRVLLLQRVLRPTWGSSTTRPGDNAREKQRQKHVVRNVFIRKE